MSIFDGLFPLGLGTNRFAVSGPTDCQGLERAANLVAEALNQGVSYIDVSPTYSKGVAAEVCRLAFQRTNAPRHVTIKSSFLSDKNRDDALRRVEQTFRLMEIDQASYFVCWNISSWEQFQKITRTGGLYDGAIVAKEHGLVEHICFSSHAAPDEIIRMLETGLFEGVTVSYSPMNSQVMAPVLDCALERNIGVVVMNPLGGGVIPLQADYFSFLCHPGDRNAVEAALRFDYAHPAVKIVLSGMSSRQELAENLATFRGESPEPDEARLRRVQAHFSSMEGFCTGCRYCDGCPQGINIFEMMQAYNTHLFPRAAVAYRRTDPELIADIAVCNRLKNTFAFLPETAKNPCVACGACETHCTAHLPIIQRIREMYAVFEARCFSRQGMLQRLEDLIGDSRRVALYPGGGYTAYVISLLNEALSGRELELSAFDSSPAMWGNTVAGIEVRNPDELLELQPDLVLISNYNYSQEIYDQLRFLQDKGIRVEKLHQEMDVPWVF